MLNPSNHVLFAVIDNKKEQEHFLEALSAIRIKAQVRFISSHEQLINLLSSNADEGSEKYLEPNLILLVAELNNLASIDLIKKLKSLDKAKKIPLIIVSKDHNDSQLRSAYRLGAASVIKHPSHFESMLKILQVLDEYWFNTVKLPVAQ